MGQQQTTKPQEPPDSQNSKWTGIYSQESDKFGPRPSAPGRYALEAFKKEDRTTILELGGGQGRDTFPFARSGLRVHVLDYVEAAVEAINGAAADLGLARQITAIRHDVRDPLPFDDESLDACYSHMLYCMSLTTPDLERLSGEIRRVLKPSGLCIYTVRHTGDPHFGAGVHKGENMYEVGGITVHFFDRRMIEHLAQGYQILNVAEFEEGDLPRKLFRVTLRREAT